MHNFPIAKDAFPYIFSLLTLTVLFYFVFMPLSVIFFVLLAFVGYFFRNPFREIPEGDRLVVSPADGKVMSVSEIDEPLFLGSRAIKITIFLNIFNVHINRSPIEGTVKLISYRPGKFLPAYKSHASEVNERNTVGIEGGGARILVHQITGLVARRIVCWVKEGDTLLRGGRFGLIKFGSCTEVIVPLNTEIRVKPGDKVHGGTTLIGVIQ